MSKEDLHKNDEILNKLILDIKALVLLSENDDQLSSTVQENIVGSHDEQVSKFISSIKPVGNTGNLRGYFLTALGELVLASFLTVVGLSLLAPSLMGIQSPNQLLSYFSEIVNGISSNSLSNPLIPVLDFLFALLLLLGSFYLLRHASVDLKHAGLSE